MLMPSRSFIGVPPPMPSSFVVEVMETLDLRGGIVEYARSGCVIFGNRYCRIVIECSRISLLRWWDFVSVDGFTTMN